MGRQTLTAFLQFQSDFWHENGLLGCLQARKRAAAVPSRHTSSVVTTARCRFLARESLESLAFAFGIALAPR